MAGNGPTSNTDWRNGSGYGNTSTGGSPSFIPYAPTSSTVVAMTLEKMKPDERKKYAEKLRKAGFRTAPLSGEIGPAFIEAAASFTAAYNDWVKNPVYANESNQAFLNRLIRQNAGEETGGGFKGGPRSSTTIINDTDAAALIDKVYRDLTGRGANEGDIKRYTQEIRTAQKKNPTITNYADDGTVRSTKGGINEQQLLIEKLSKTDEVKARKVLGFYEAFKQALGVS